MRSVDKNVLARAMLNDDDRQTALAKAVLATPCYVTSTVVMETMWVLGYFGLWNRAQIAEGIEIVLDLSTMSVANREAVFWAFDRYRDGADFPDMLHVALSGIAAIFVTFDRKVQKYAVGAPVRLETLR